MIKGLFGHAKPKEEAKPEVKVEESVVNTEPETVAEAVETEQPVSAIAETVNTEAEKIEAVSAETEVAFAQSENEADIADIAVPNFSVTTESAEEAVTETQTQPLNEHRGARFSVGIDLGTTHCVLSYVDLADTSDDKIILEVMPIPQLIEPGIVEDKMQLPSFVYLAHEAEISGGDKALPWTTEPEFLVGEIARNMGGKTPIRLVASAKSWLCHAGVDCKSAILPADSPDEIERFHRFKPLSLI
jgi:hypothetical protein